LLLAANRLIQWTSSAWGAGGRRRLPGHSEILLCLCQKL